MGIVIFVILVLVTVGLTIANQKTPLPEGCKAIQCEGCHIQTCSLRKEEKS